jgi:hypothetical protein
MKTYIIRRITIPNAGISAILGRGKIFLKTFADQCLGLIMKRTSFEFKPPFLLFASPDFEEAKRRQRGPKEEKLNST